MPKSPHWPERDGELRYHRAHGKTWQDIAILMGLTKTAVKSHACRIGLTKRPSKFPKQKDIPKETSGYDRRHGGGASRLVLVSGTSTLPPLASLQMPIPKIEEK